MTGEPTVWKWAFNWDKILTTSLPLAMCINLHDTCNSYVINI